MNNGNVPARIHPELMEIINKIVEQEKERGNDSISIPTASHILAKRIQEAGGLKE